MRQTGSVVRKVSRRGIGRTTVTYQWTDHKGSCQETDRKATPAPDRGGSGFLPPGRWRTLESPPGACIGWAIPDDPDHARRWATVRAPAYESKMRPTTASIKDGLFRAVRTARRMRRKNRDLVTPRHAIEEGRRHGVRGGKVAEPQMGVSQARILALYGMQTGAPRGIRVFQAEPLACMDDASARVMDTAPLECRGVLGLPLRGVTHLYPCWLTADPALWDRMAKGGGRRRWRPAA